VKKLLLLLSLAWLPSVSAAQDYVAEVSGWKMSDVGHKPNDDSERSVLIEKNLPGVSLVYGPNGKGNGGSLKAIFPASKGCRGLEFSAAFDFEIAKAAPATEVRNEINAVFATFRARCPGKAISAVELLNGFDDAFAAVQRRVAEQPYIFPPTMTSGERSLPQSQSQGQ
jgi:hypothetical protein